MKKIMLVLLLVQTVLLSAQRLNFNIQNDSIDNELYLTKLNGKVLETIRLETLNFTTDINFDEGYYFLQKEEDKVLLYLHKNDEFSISYDADDFNRSLKFSGKKGAVRNNYLLNKRTERIDATGIESDFYKRKFYQGDENAYLERLDNYYKGFYGILFASNFSERFINEESKNLQYGYYADILKFEKAKKHYKFTDSIKISKAFYAPLQSIPFDNQLFSDRYNAYNELAVLKWKRDIENSNDYPVMEGIVADIQTSTIQKRLLVRLYKAMSKDAPSRMKAYLDFIKRYAKDNALIAKAKRKYDEVRQVEAEKKLSKFRFKSTNRESVTLADFKGNYIFIYLWMSSCKDCLKTFKTIEKLSDEFSDKNIVFLGVSLDKKSKFELWANKVKENGLRGSGEQLFFDQQRAKLVKAYNLSVIPTYVILSPKGEQIETKDLKLSYKKVKRLLNKVLKE